MSSKILYEGRVTRDRFTIYSSVAQRSQTWSSLTAGKSIIIPIPKETNTQSVVVFQSDERGTTQAIPYILVSGEEDLVVEVRKNSDHYRGLLLDVGVDNVVIQGVKNGCSGRDIYQIFDYDLIVVSQGERDEVAQYIKIVPLSTGPLTINYLINGISWRAHHTVVMDDVDNKVIYWRVGGTIRNRSGIQFQASEVILMSGDINQPISSTPKSRNALMASAAPVSDFSSEVQVQSVEDFIAYRIPQQLQLDETTNVEVTTLGDFDVTKLYRADLISSQYDSKTEILYRFTSTSYIPAGQAIIYKFDSKEDELGPLIGATMIRESQPGDDVDLVLGYSTRVRCESVINTDTTRGNEYRIITTTISSKITNRNDEAIILILTYPKQQQTIEYIQCQSAVIKSNHIEWAIEVQPTQDEPAEFLCSFSVRELNSPSVTN
jgi:hypothetical protein